MIFLLVMVYYLTMNLKEEAKLLLVENWNASRIKECKKYIFRESRYKQGLGICIRAVGGVCEMLQKEKPRGLCFATRTNHTVREFIGPAFGELNMNYHGGEW